MLFTVTSRLAAAALLMISATAAASSSNQAPRFVSVPVVGLRLPIDRLNLDKFPEDLRARCDQIADNDQYTGQVWIFGKAKDAASTYFILTGIFKRRSADPKGERPLYENWENGVVFIVEGNNCDGEDAVETFQVSDLNAENNGNVPMPILRQLAHDLAAQTVRAFGGADRLRAAIKKQRIKLNRLTPELQEAFKPYFRSVD